MSEFIDGVVVGAFVSILSIWLGYIFTSHPEPKPKRDKFGTGRRNEMRFHLIMARLNTIERTIILNTKQKPTEEKE